MTATSLIDGYECPVTGDRDWKLIAKFNEPPTGETDFNIPNYYRELWQGNATGHVVNRHEMDLGALYGGDYWDKTYGDGRIDRIFDKIMDLPEGRSDNRERVFIINGFYRSVSGDHGDAPTLLDVGSGLAVFPAAMREAGWVVSALDPDPRAARHAEERAGATGIVADFMVDRIEGCFDLVSFNKVLEHVPDPVAMLSRARNLIKDNGFCYVELPDAEGALEDSAAREEFFIEHYCAFSMASYAMLAKRAGFRVAQVQRVVEPSGKYTLRGFLTVAPGSR